MKQLSTEHFPLDLIKVFPVPGVNAAVRYHEGNGGSSFLMDIGKQMLSPIGYKLDSELYEDGFTPLWMTAGVLLETAIGGGLALGLNHFFPGLIDNLLTEVGVILGAGRLLSQPLIGLSEVVEDISADVSYNRRRL